MTPQRLELLRAQVQQELEAPIRERFNKLQEVTDAPLYHLTPVSMTTTDIHAAVGILSVTDGNLL